MTADERIEKLLNAFGQTIADLPKPTEENIMKKLKRDTYFGHEKAEDERGISSELMAMVVRGWCKVLELPDLVLEDDGYYHHRQFNVVAAHFGWNLEEELEEEA